MIPERKTELKPQPKRFYVQSNTRVHFELQKEAYRRGINALELGGLVLAQWIEAGFPNLSSVEHEENNQVPSSLVTESDRGGQQ